MRAFVKFFLAALLALVLFFGLVFVVMLTAIGSLASRSQSPAPGRSILYIDLSRHYAERKVENPFKLFSGDDDGETPTLRELVRLVDMASKDSSVKGIYLLSNSNGNGYAASDEIRDAVKRFRGTGKFVIAYGDYISQGAYHVANVADRIYCNPQGDLDWRGFSVSYVFFKQLIDRLGIQPQIFYDGKFKSATEPFREDHMTAANRIQTEAWLGDMYRGFLEQTASARRLDTASLRAWANTHAMETPDDAVRSGLLDGVRYDDQVRDEIKQRLNIRKEDKIPFLMPGTYMATMSEERSSSKDKIALVYADGEIVYGKSEEGGQVASDEYRSVIRRIRYDKDVKAIVLRVNSPGGSSLASEIIWRELTLASQGGIPVVVSMGDLAASGGYYISCLADSVFAEPNTLTGSIGVFSIVPNFGPMLKNKLGITFDGVKTANYADALTVTRALTDQEKRIMQRDVDRIYGDFKARVAAGRKMDTAFVDSIAQGRVWTGNHALANHLVDRLGHLDDAIRSAARLAKLKDYTVREYPEPRSIFDLLKGKYSRYYRSSMLESDLGTEQYAIFNQIARLKEANGEVQARIPWTFTIR